ncbi:pyruvate dehydrogenase (acetyl-transferring) E1 component subunit alpha [Virgibacillus sp. NKC19-16]|uniref:pyruvate dehydrogenase (acetyl-transferring) E1 component subunit alpha n=1 Tax=Virgibacillus salidurans TaxID=2831673 RepID=UPI001F1ECEA9|nr:pyruvate dehydrogenase (acetyl-transferring) E1 component subunit alpha [Virgibacillus sp. NKC19-16]UJL45535.1 pyruvate dehydrogenase (acetyl-transferring) E1 component subunit alpha [Virgibacillus sp. NKC19-16]
MNWIVQDKIDIVPVRRLNEQGELTEDTVLSENDQLRVYKWMVKARRFDELAVKFQRQGKIGTYAPLSGQEAAQVGSAFALEDEDWIFPSYREAAACFVRGAKVSSFFKYTMGHVHGGILKEEGIFPVQIIIGAQALHATGSAWADQYKKREGVSVAYFGDGATSQGDFHEALNFAGVFQVPVIYFVQNNQWAISVPYHKQTGSKSIAQKATAYGITGIQVDGNDAVAIYETMKQARSLAITGKPVLIEAITHRMGPHTTSDDPTKYRSLEDDKSWAEKDPILRFRKWLEKRDLWNEEQEKELIDSIDEELKQGYIDASEAPAASLEDALGHVYEKMTPRLLEQLSELEGREKGQ